MSDFWYNTVFKTRYGEISPSRHTTTGAIMRKVEIKRETKETKIFLELDLDGSGEGEIDTGVGFFNHMLELLKKHALIDLTVKAKGSVSRKRREGLSFSF